MNQAQQVLEHLQAGHKITSLKALRVLGIIQLPRRIWDLKREGHQIEREWIYRTNRYGDRVRIAEYSLEGNNDTA